jgi:branched-chain amino acid transport system substrate-binding protein
MYRSIEEVFPVGKLLELSRPGGLRLGVSANVAGHTRELCAAVRLALEDAPPGLNVEVIWRDDERSATGAKATAQYFLTRGVHAVVGHLSASASLAAARAYDGRCVFFAPGTSHPDLVPAGSASVFRVYGRDDDQGRAIVRLLRHLAPRRVLLLEQDLPYGHALASAVKGSWSLAGTELRLLLVPHDAPLRARALEAAAGMSPDVVVFAGIHEVALEVVKRVREGKGCRTILGDDGYVAEFLEQGGPAAEGTIIMAVRDDRRPEAPELCRRFRELTGRVPGAYFLTSYAAMQILLRAAREAGYRPAEMAEQIGSQSWSTCLGEISFYHGEVRGMTWTAVRIEAQGFRPSEIDGAFTLEREREHVP